MGWKHDSGKTSKLASEIRQALNAIRTLGQTDESEFLADPDKPGNAKYQLIVAIEGCLDLGNHLISQNNLRMPEGYADTFDILADEGLIEDAFADELGKMARFRNRLVHLYWDVDDATVYGYLSQEADDIQAFLELVLEAIQDD